MRQESQEREYQRLRFEEDQFARARRRAIVHRIIWGITYLVGALQILLGLRFLLRLTAANPDNTFAGFIYSLSQPFVAPFSTLFISPTFDGNTHIFDVNILVAMIAYLVLALLAIWLVRILSNR
ncbi:YggT family protein [Pseudanabaena sp. FACHB-2040]|nr:YggT family protein [Pseudanabaena sp. FACHB-2040]MBD2256402.1 YggT family protein [Pseudanabaena sp. FACHB-2040]